MHCADLSNDGFLYVCDRVNDRIQVFRPDGTFVKEAFIAKNTRASGSVWDVAFSKDPQQRYLYVADGINNRIYVLQRDTLELLTSFGDGGRQPGQFYGVHSIAVDSKGNIYTTETWEGKRVQRFVFKGVERVPRHQGVVWPRATTIVVRPTRDRVTKSPCEPTRGTHGSSGKATNPVRDAHTTSAASRGGSLRVEQSCVASTLSHNQAPTQSMATIGNKGRVVAAEVRHDVSKHHRRDRRRGVGRRVHESEHCAGMLSARVEAHRAEVGLLQQDAGIGERQEPQRPAAARRQACVAAMKTAAVPSPSDANACGVRSQAKPANQPVAERDRRSRWRRHQRRTAARTAPAPPPCSRVP